MTKLWGGGGGGGGGEGTETETRPGGDEWPGW